MYFMIEMIIYVARCCIKMYIIFYHRALKGELSARMTLQFLNDLELLSS